MSHETQIGSLSGGISDEDSKLVDSILNDLNSHSGGQEQQQEQAQAQQQQAQQQQQQQQQQRPPGQELTPEQMKHIHMQRQMAMQQQQLMQQQQMAQQQMAAQQQMQQGPNEKKEMVQTGDSFMDNIKNEAKSVALIIFLSIVLNLEQVDNLFKSQPSLFVGEGGAINMQAIFIKALIIGSIFYGVKTYLL